MERAGGLAGRHDPRVDAPQSLTGLSAIPMFGRVARIAERGGLLWTSFVLCVVLPTLIGAFYIVFFAPRQYVAEFRVVVRSVAQSDFRLTDALGGGTAAMFAPPSSGVQNAFMVADYLKSRNMVAALGGKPALLGIYSRDKGAWPAGLSANASLEQVWHHWQSVLHTQIDMGSGILSVQVRAFVPQDALLLANRMIASSEKMINDMSDRSRADALLRARQQVDHAQTEIVAAHQALLDFRNRQQVIDPAKNADITGGLLTGLAKERMALDAQRAAMGPQLSANSPIARLMQNRQSDLDNQMAKLHRQLTDPGAASAISTQLATYENLQLKSQFAEQVYKLSQAAYEAAREAKQRQQLYLMTVVKPVLPEEVLYPRIGADIFLVFGLSLILWSIGALLVAAVLDHVN